MNPVKISVNKQFYGYTFSITPSIQENIKRLFPGSQPANNIFVAYDIKSDFEKYLGRPEHFIFPALLGINSESDPKKIEEIQFIDTRTRKTFHKVTLVDQQVQSIFSIEF